MHAAPQRVRNQSLVEALGTHYVCVYVCIYETKRQLKEWAALNMGNKQSLRMEAATG